jgi:hypothetical protein
VSTAVGPVMIWSAYTELLEGRGQPHISVIRDGVTRGLIGGRVRREAIH